MATLRTVTESLPERSADASAVSDGGVRSPAAWVLRATVRRQLNAWAMAIFTWLEVLAVALGLMIYAGDPFGFVHPRLALGSMLAMVATAIVARSVPVLRRHTRWTRSIEVVALFFYAILMTTSMGAANSPFIALYAVTLLAAALSWEPVWVVTLALLTVGFTLLQTGFMDLMDEMPLFVLIVVALNALLPAAVAAVIIAVVRAIGSRGASDADPDAAAPEQNSSQRP